MILANKSDVAHDAVNETQVKNFMAKHKVNLYR